jgi:hypothetical protein
MSSRLELGQLPTGCNHPPIPVWMRTQLESIDRNIHDCLRLIDWIILRNTHPEEMSSALPPNPDIARRGRHFAFVPCVDGSELARAFFTFCSIGRCGHVFGLLSAVHMTAGHNALRGSGPGQKPAFR